MTYSCSGGIGLELFQKIVAGAAADVGVEARIMHRLSAAPDHPIGLAVPEGEVFEGAGLPGDKVPGRVLVLTHAKELCMLHMNG
jgi:hypothetical protein